MSRVLFPLAFALGAGAVGWMAAGFVGADALALSVTTVIGCVYTLGFVELSQFRRATASLSTALVALPDRATSDRQDLDRWLAGLHPSLQLPLRQRIEGERVALPTPVITPYLVSLLVMLGLLGTFVGMVDTLRGAVFALEGTTELQAIRAGLAAPIQGLSLAFGTSVAGVAASAMLGLSSTLSRRDRMLAIRVLDRRAAQVFKALSLSHQRQQAYQALQSQAQALPEVAGRLDALADRLEHLGETLSAGLLQQQTQFHQSATQAYRDLARSVDQSLQQSLATSGRQAGESIKPIIIDAMTTISDSAERTQQRLVTTAQQQLVGFSAQFEGIATGLLTSFNDGATTWAERQRAEDQQRREHWAQAFSQAQEQTLSHLDQATGNLVDQLTRSTEGQRSALADTSREFEALSAALAQQWQQAGGQLEGLTATLGVELKRLRDEEAQRGGAAIERLAGLEARAAEHLAALGRTLEEPMRRLIETAAETPRAAAEVIGQLRREIGNNLERDNQLLEERQRILAQLHDLSGALEQATTGQRKAVDQLLDQSSSTLQRLQKGFAARVDAGLSKLSSAAEQCTSSSAEMACLGEGFGLAIDRFNTANGQLVEQLGNIEDALGRSTARSDEQMAYYVAQAGDIIDQNLLAQKEILDALRSSARREQPLAAEAI